MKVRVDLRAISISLRALENLTGTISTEDEGLKVLVTEPARYHHLRWYQMMKELPVDPWGQAYQYRLLPGPESGYDLFSLGRDGKISEDDIHLPQSETAP